MKRVCALSSYYYLYYCVLYLVTMDVQTSQSSKSLPANLCGVHLRGLGGELSLPRGLGPDKPITNCQWSVEAPMGTYLLFDAKSFHISQGPSERCTFSYLRFLDQGKDVPIPISTQCGSIFELVYIDSNRALIKFRFYPGDTSISSFPEFSISWTAYTMEPIDKCSGFYCAASGMCIDQSLVCNGLPNCGYDDKSDEICPTLPFWKDKLKMGVGISLTTVIILMAIIAYVCRWQIIKHRREHHRMLTNSATCYCPVELNRQPGVDGVRETELNEVSEDSRCGTYIPPPPYYGVDTRQESRSTEHERNNLTQHHEDPPPYPGLSSPPTRQAPLAPHILQSHYSQQPSSTPDFSQYTRTQINRG